MHSLELLAPARNADIGIAAVDCGADAVYIAGPDFGARKEAGNSVEDVKRLCDYAHKFGARIFVTFNILVEEHEKQELHAQMLAAQNAGADAFIVRDLSVCEWDDITVPLHASTQCAIQDAERARLFVNAGCSRIVLERQMSLKRIQEIHNAVDAEIEFFVHGALCTGYSGQCTLSAHLNGRSADRGECIQACRSLYTLLDENGMVLVKDKALLSLKDYQLIDRLEDLAEAGVSSFKIEGRLKSISYVRNVVRAYSLALDKLVKKHPQTYCRASFGHASGAFTPDTRKTFNRGYTELYLDGVKGRWSSMDAPKSMGEPIGKVLDVRPIDKWNVRLRLESNGKVLANGDGFSFVKGSAIIGFRADVCSGNEILCKRVDGLAKGVFLYRNISAAFEKEMDAHPAKRMISVNLDVNISETAIELNAHSEDGRSATARLDCTEVPAAQNRQRMLDITTDALQKSSGVFDFHIEKLQAGECLPLLRNAQLNNLRRAIADNLDLEACGKRPMQNALYRTYVDAGTGRRDGELMRSRYCIRHELGICPKQDSHCDNAKLIAMNNYKILQINFHCRECEMSITPVRK